MRSAEKRRETRETKIRIRIDLDGKGSSSIHTGIGFFDHMLTAFSKHSGFDLDIEVQGDLEVDTHHTVEDTGIVLGEVFREALGSMEGVSRYGSSYVPMDESLVLAVTDLSNRPYLVLDLPLKAERLGTLETETLPEFFQAFTYSARINLHIKAMYGSNTHHLAEAAFKAMARSLKESVRKDASLQGVLSTKGVLE